MATTQPRIAIIGAGPAGLVLLLTLHNRGIPATIYERDSHASERGLPSGPLDLGWTSGQRALRENGLQDAFTANSRVEGHEYRMLDSQGNLLVYSNFEDVPKDDLRPEIDRPRLRQIMLDAVPSELIKWRYTLTSAKSLGDGTHQLAFGNGTTAVVDILIGADGAHSRVRPLVSTERARYVGLNGPDLSLAPGVIEREDMADLRALIGKGLMVAQDDDRELNAQLTSDGRVRGNAHFRAPELWTAPPGGIEALREELREVYKGWSPVLVKLIEHCEPDLTDRRPLYQLPVGHSWAHVRGVTLIGDAAHVMTPYAGAGANISMLDGLELGLVISKAVNEGASDAERETAVANWEKRMFAAAAQWAKVAEDNMEAMISPDAPASAKARWELFLQEGGRQEDYSTGDAA